MCLRCEWLLPNSESNDKTTHSKITVVSVYVLLKMDLYLKQECWWLPYILWIEQCSGHSRNLALQKGHMLKVANSLLGSLALYIYISYHINVAWILPFLQQALCNKISGTCIRQNTLKLKRVIVSLFSKWVFTCSKDFYNGIAGYGNIKIKLSDLHFC